MDSRHMFILGADESLELCSRRAVACQAEREPHRNASCHMPSGSGFLLGECSG